MTTPNQVADMLCCLILLRHLNCFQETANVPYFAAIVNVIASTVALSSTSVRKISKLAHNIAVSTISSTHPIDIYQVDGFSVGH